jgi:hypothetical protein
LLEVEGDAGFLALVADVGDPLGGHRTGVGARLAANDYPVDASEFALGHWAQQGLVGKEPNVCIGLAQEIDPIGTVGVFDGDALPDVTSPGQLFADLG